jgi:hypothetical protein
VSAQAERAYTSPSASCWTFFSPPNHQPLLYHPPQSHITIFFATQLRIENTYLSLHHHQRHQHNLPSLHHPNHSPPPPTLFKRQQCTAKRLNYMDLGVTLLAGLTGVGGIKWLGTGAVGVVEAIGQMTMPTRAEENNHHARRTVVAPLFTRQALPTKMLPIHYTWPPRPFYSSRASITSSSLGSRTLPPGRPSTGAVGHASCIRHCCSVSRNCFLFVISQQSKVFFVFFAGAKDGG